MAVSRWLFQRNEKARSRLMRNLPDVFPRAVLVHALSRPFLPATPRRAVDSYWRYHPVRADKLARALAALSGEPEGWVWRVRIEKSGPLASFRVPPPRFVNRPIRRAQAIAVCAGSPYFGSAGIATFGATTAQIRTPYGTQLLRCGLEPMDCTERSCPAPEGSSEAPLSRNRGTAAQVCRGRSSRSPVQGLARLSQQTVACTAGLLGRPEPAGHQSIRSRGKERPRGGGT
jgi:hypothetical protein